MSKAVFEGPFPYGSARYWAAIRAFAANVLISSLWDESDETFIHAACYLSDCTGVSATVIYSDLQERIDSIDNLD